MPPIHSSLPKNLVMNSKEFEQSDGVTSTRPPRVMATSRVTGEEEVTHIVRHSSYDDHHLNPQGGDDRMPKVRTCGKRPLNLKREKLSIGTWNVQTLYQTGKLELLKHEMTRYKWDILGISEIHWTGQGENNDGTIIYSGNETRHEAGVAIMMNLSAKAALMEYKPVSDRMIMARFKSHPFNITILQVYAPTSDADEEVTDKFYAQLQQCVDQINSQDMLICMGDWNAKIGTARDGWEDVMGKFGFGERNERGERLLQFASINELYILNTKFKHKASRKWTWESPNGRDRNMIDLILIKKR